MKQTKAFIAAPLLGTLIFLIAIFLMINMIKEDNNAVQQVVEDSQHNRLISLMDIYRMDLGSLFRSGLSSNLEIFLARKGWVSAYTFSNDPRKLSNTEIECDSDFNGQINLSELRLCKCVHQNMLTNSIICSHSGTSGIDVENFRLQTWFRFLSNPLYFEGIEYSLANQEQSKLFTDYNNPGQYFALCAKLIKEAMFDCEAYSRGIMQCCKKQTITIVPNMMIPSLTPCNINEILEGCEQGTFMVKINITDPDVFPLLPRISAKIGSSNYLELRSGAISDSDFFLPINYPFFKYQNEAFKFFEKIAYGNSVSNTCEGENEGIADGLCLGNPSSSGGGCPSLTTSSGSSIFTCPGNAYLNSPMADPEQAKDELVDAFLRGPFRKACESVSGLTVQVCKSISGCREDDDVNSPDWINCIAAISDSYFRNVLKGTVDTPECQSSSAPNAYCAYFSSSGDQEFPSNLNIAIRFIDYSPQYRVYSESPNFFFFYVNPAKKAS